jgi:GntR family transcriptional regulator
MDVAQAAGLVTPDDIPEGTIRAMARAGHVEVGHVDEITGRMPTPAEAQTLDMGTGVPLLVYVRTAWTAERPVRLTRTLFPADRNRLTYELGTDIPLEATA